MQIGCKIEQLITLHNRNRTSQIAAKSAHKLHKLHSSESSGSDTTLWGPAIPARRYKIASRLHAQ